MVLKKSTKSLNFDKRAGGVDPSMIIIHYTGMPSEEAALHRLCDPDSKVSSHYFINESGETLRLVDEDKRAWHAGISFWGGITDINSHSIGIELVNPGHEFGYRSFPDKQISALVKLCRRLIADYTIPAAHVLAHSDIAPKRKEDPGELFPWKLLAAEGVGLWPVVKESETHDDPALRAEASFSKMLATYGYNLDVPYGKLVMAFHRHFYPEKFLGRHDPAEVDNTSVARLQALLRDKKSA